MLHINGSSSYDTAVSWSEASIPHSDHTTCDRNNVRPPTAEFKARVRAEWDAGGSTEAFFLANCRFDGFEAIEGLLPLAGGKMVWGASGLDPANGFRPVTDWAQCKPSEPIVFADGKTIRYFGPSKKNARANRAIVLAPSVGSWSDGPNGKPVALVEGVKKGATLDALGYRVVSGLGVWNFTELADDGSYHLVAELRELVRTGFTDFLICFDADDKATARYAVKAARERLTSALEAEGCRVTAPSWSSALGKGIDDVWAANGRDVVRDILDRAAPVGRKGRIAFSPTQNERGLGSAIFYSIERHGWAQRSRSLTKKQSALYKAACSAAKLQAELDGAHYVAPAKPNGQGPLSRALLEALATLDEVSMLPDRDGKPCPFGIRFDAQQASEALNARFTLTIGAGLDIHTSSLPHVSRALNTVIEAGLRLEGVGKLDFKFLIAAHNAGLTPLCVQAKHAYGSMLWVRYCAHLRRDLKACGNYSKLGADGLGPAGYLPEYSNPDRIRLTVIKAPMGSGKTQSMKNYIARFDGTALYLVHRAGLCESVGNVLELATRTAQYRDGRKLAACIEQFKAKTALGLSPGFCKGGLIVCDEVRSLLTSLSTSSTLLGERAKVTDAFAEALRVSGEVTLVDAHITSNEVRAIQSLMNIGPEETRILDYTTKRMGGRTAFLYEHYNTAESCLLSEVQSAVVSGLPVWEASDSLGDLSRGMRTIRARCAAIQQLIPEAVLGEVSSVTRSATDHPDHCLELDIPALVTRTLIQSSPAVDSGLSVTADNPFAAVFGFFTGVSRSDAQQQMLERVRFGCDRHVYTDKKQPPVGDGSASFGAAMANGLLREEIFASDHISLLESEGLPSFAQTAILKSSDSPAVRVVSEWVARTDALENVWRAASRENMAFDLERAGYQVKIVEGDSGPVMPPSERLEIVTAQVLAGYEEIVTADRGGEADLDQGTLAQMAASKRASLSATLDCGPAPDLDVFEAIALDKKSAVINNRLCILSSEVWKERLVARLVAMSGSRLASDLSLGLTLNTTLEKLPTLHELIRTILESQEPGWSGPEKTFAYQSGDEWCSKVFEEMREELDRLTVLGIPIPTSPHNLSRTIRAFLKAYGIVQANGGETRMVINSNGNRSSSRSFVVNPPEAAPPEALVEDYEVQLTKAVKGVTRRILAWAVSPQGIEDRKRRLEKRVTQEAVAMATIENRLRPEEF